jgi:hypothetical protein
MKCITTSEEYVDFFPFISFGFSCNLASCRIGDFDVVFMTQFLKSNTLCFNLIVSPPTPEKNCVRACGCLISAVAVAGVQPVAVVLRRSRMLALYFSRPQSLAFYTLLESQLRVPSHFIAWRIN